MQFLELFGGTMERLESSIQQKPPRERGFAYLVAVLAVMSGMLSGAVTAVIAVWWHDAETRGRLGARLDDQDKALEEVADAVAAEATSSAKQASDQQAMVETQKGLVVVVEGLLDEHETMAEWLPVALEAGFGKKPIPRMTSSVAKLRRKMPVQ